MNETCKKVSQVVYVRKVINQLVNEVVDKLESAASKAETERHKREFLENETNDIINFSVKIILERVTEEEEIARRPLAVQEEQGVVYKAARQEKDEDEGSSKTRRKNIEEWKKVWEGVKTLDQPKD